jgi:hypothetical protein
MGLMDPYVFMGCVYGPMDPMVPTDPGEGAGRWAGWVGWVGWVIRLDGRTGWVGGRGGWVRRVGLVGWSGGLGGGQWDLIAKRSSENHQFTHRWSVPVLVHQVPE